MELSAVDLYDAFPDCLPIIRQQLTYWRNAKADREESFRPILVEAHCRGVGWFFEALVASVCDDVPDRHISRLSRLKGLYEYKREQAKPLEKRKEKPVPLDIEKAKQAPICEVYRPEKIKQTHGKAICPCPFHSETNPSFTVYLKTNTWYCFSCGKGGDVIKLYMEINGTDFITTVKLLGG